MAFFLCSLLICEVAGGPQTEPVRPKEEVFCELFYALEEGIRLEQNVGSTPRNPPRAVETASYPRSLDGKVLRMSMYWKLSRDDSGNPVIDAEVTTGEFTFTHSSVASRFSRPREWFHYAYVDRLRFRVKLLPKQTQVAIDKSCLGDLRRKWGTCRFGDGPLSFRKGFPALQRCLSEIFGELFAFLRPGVKWPLPKQFRWRAPVRADTSGPSVGILLITSKLQDKGPGKHYVLNGKYFGKKGAKVNAGNIGTWEIRTREVKGIRLPVHYKLEIKAYAIGAPKQPQIRFHKKELRCNIVDADTTVRKKAKKRDEEEKKKKEKNQ